MIEHAHSRERADRRRRRLTYAIVVGSFLALVGGLAFGVVAWGWLRSVGALYAISVVLLIALFTTDNRAARRTGRQIDDR